MGSEDGFRDEEHLAGKDNDNLQLALYAAIDIVSDLTPGAASKPRVVVDRNLVETSVSATSAGRLATACKL